MKNTIVGEWAWSRTLVLTLAVAVALSLLLGLGDLDARVAAAQGMERVEGVFGLVHADPIDLRGEGILHGFVTDARYPSRGVRIAVPSRVAARYGGVEALMGKRVAITASRTAGAAAGTRNELTALAIDVQGDASKGVSLDLSAFPQGKATPTLTIMCRFADKPVEPADQSYLNGLAGQGSLLDSYWQNVSYQQIHLGGSKVVPAAGPWLVLPGKEADYLTNTGNGTDFALQVGKKEMKLGKLFEDCTGLAAGLVNLDDFAVINMAFNTSFIGYAFGGGMGGRRLTWLPEWSWRNAGVTGHEMGHAYGMTHVGWKGEYDSAWDVMSGATMACATHDTYTCVPQHPSAYNKDRAGWLTNRRVDVPLNTTTTVNLRSLSNPGPGTVAAKISPDEFHSYYVEFRTAAGLDAHLPLGEVGAVIIHEAWKFNDDFKGDMVTGTNGKTGAHRLTGSVFARWQEETPREPFFWEFDGVLVRVDSIGATSATVTITHLPRPGLFPKKGTQTANSYTISWEDGAAAATRYEILVSDQPNNPNSWKTVIVPANKTSHTFTNVPSDKQFAHAVRACNNVGCGPQTFTLTYGTTEKPLNNP
jgi:hypothetical protein